MVSKLQHWPTVYFSHSTSDTRVRTIFPSPVQVQLLRMHPPCTWLTPRQVTNDMRISESCISIFVWLVILFFRLLLCIIHHLQNIPEQDLTHLLKKPEETHSLNTIILFLYFTLLCIQAWPKISLFFDRHPLIQDLCPRFILVVIVNTHLDYVAKITSWRFSNFNSHFSHLFHLK